MEALLQSSLVNISDALSRLNSEPCEQSSPHTTSASSQPHVTNVGNAVDLIASRNNIDFNNMGGTRILHPGAMLPLPAPRADRYKDTYRDGLWQQPGSTAAVTALGPVAQANEFLRSLAWDNAMLAARLNVDIHSDPSTSSIPTYNMSAAGHQLPDEEEIDWSALVLGVEQVDDEEDGGRNRTKVLPVDDTLPAITNATVIASAVTTTQPYQMDLESIIGVPIDAQSNIMNAGTSNAQSEMSNSSAMVPAELTKVIPLTSASSAVEVTLTEGERTEELLWAIEDHLGGYYRPMDDAGLSLSLPDNNTTGSHSAAERISFADLANLASTVCNLSRMHSSTNQSGLNTQIQERTSTSPMNSYLVDDVQESELGELDVYFNMGRQEAGASGMDLLFAETAKLAKGSTRAQQLAAIRTRQLQQQQLEMYFNLGQTQARSEQSYAVKPPIRTMSIPGNTSPVYADENTDPVAMHHPQIRTNKMHESEFSSRRAAAAPTPHVSTTSGYLAPGSLEDLLLDDKLQSLLYGIGGVGSDSSMSDDPLVEYFRQGQSHAKCAKLQTFDF